MGGHFLCEMTSPVMKFNLSLVFKFKFNISLRWSILPLLTEKYMIFEFLEGFSSNPSVNFYS